MYEEDLWSFARKTVNEAGQTLKEEISKDPGVEYKKKFDLVTDTDKKIERSIVDSIKKGYPDHDIVTEEADIERTGSDHVWYLDPISGTTNYAHCMPIYGISLALEIEDEICVSAIYNSVEEEVFHAEKGEGAYMGEKEITVSQVETIEKSLVSTTFPYDEEGRKKNLEYFERIAPNVEGIRRTGSVSVDLPYLALGVLDGFWAIELKPWDTAAGLLLVEESGGSVTEIDGSGYDIHSDSIVATNGIIHEVTIERLNAGD